MGLESVLFNCPSCGGILDRCGGKMLVCGKCHKVVQYASSNYSVATKDIKAEVLVKVEDDASIVLFPLEGIIRTMSGDQKHGIILMFESDANEVNNEHRTGSTSEGRSRPNP